MKLVILFISLFFVACSSSISNEKQSIVNKLNKVTIFNQTKNDIYKVSIISLKTDKYLSSGLILSNTSFSYSFAKKVIKNNLFIITWFKNNIKYRSEHKLGDIKDKDYPLDIKIEITENNKVRIFGLERIK